MNYLKSFIFGLLYSALFCVLPLLIFILTKSANSAGLLVFYLIVAFTTLGFVAYSVISKHEPPKKTNNELLEKLETLELQNTAIAFNINEIKKTVKNNELE
jgi:ABC-type transport system involved in multi-copper enzyme maturation permease subunit